MKKMHMDRWTAAHNIIHGAAFCLDPEYHSWKHEENPEAYSDFIKLCDKVHGAGLPGEAGVRGVRASALAQAQFSMYKNGEGILQARVCWNQRSICGRGRGGSRMGST